LAKGQPIPSKTTYKAKILTHVRSFSCLKVGFDVRCVYLRLV
ncbi:hypothetical protein Goshw_029118, partial [Gossypium schwendimanii]|nr:hypothetical protein [Gossypium schwendimanii]